MQEAWPSVVRFVAGVFWLYYLAVIVNAQVIVSGPGSIALGRFGWVPEWLR